MTGLWCVAGSIVKWAWLSPTIRFHLMIRFPHRKVTCLLAAGLVLAAPVVGQAQDPAAVQFEKQVRPLLVKHCIKCHGPRKQEGGLRLDSREAILKGGETGPAVPRVLWLGHNRAGRAKRTGEQYIKATRGRVGPVKPSLPGRFGLAFFHSQRNCHAFL